MRIPVLFLLAPTTTGLLVLLASLCRRSMASIIKELFKMDTVTGMASVELWVVLTTAMLVIRFLLDFYGPWYTNKFVNSIIMTVEAMNYSLVHYTMGLMQLSAARVNDYFQVWAVLLVTLQYSVKIGRPYSRSKQIPLLDLMSSFWAANLIRMQTFLHLRIFLWLIWAVNAARIISYFSSSDKAEAINQASTKLVADYMSYEHKLSGPQLSADAANHSKEFTMKWYKFLVIGEDQALKDLQEMLDPAEEVQPDLVQRKKCGVWLDPSDNENLVTIDKIWDVSASESGLLGSNASQINRLNESTQTSTMCRLFAACHADKLRDVCLSFSLYKQLRRHFYDLPIHEVRLPIQMKKMKRLVFQYILNDAERAFRITAAELSFLQDLFYSKRAAIFATGFPATNLALSVLLIAATGYIAYPIRYIPERMDQLDHNRITHGVFITRVIITLIIGKELAEIYMYVFSQWTKVLMLCNYTKCQCLWHPLVETAMRVMFCLMTRGRWNEMICQRNLLISSRFLKAPGLIISFPSKVLGNIKMETCTKEAIFTAFKNLENEPKSEREDSYISKAFGEPKQLLQGQLVTEVLNLEADTLRILVWHIATSICEIELASDKASKIRPFWLRWRPFVQKPKVDTSSPHLQTTSTTNEDIKEVKEAMWQDNYTTATTLSNYCAYLVMQALVPDNGLVASKVIQEVFREINYVTKNNGSIRSLFRHLESLSQEMVGLDDFHGLVSSIFIMLHKKTLILFRIEFLVVFATILFLAMFIMDIFRRYMHNSVTKAIFCIFDAVSDSILIYLLGAMQTTPFKNQLFPVWALVLVIFRYSVDFISGYGVPDIGGRRFTEWRNVVKLLGSALLTWRRGSRFAGPLWSLWALQILRSLYRFKSRDLALNSPLHGRSSEIISEHMREDRNSNYWTPERCNPWTMEGYKYLVYGEKVKLHKPEYVVRIDPTSISSQRNAQQGRHLPAEGEGTSQSSTVTQSSLITLDKIWRCRRNLLFTGRDRNEPEDNDHETDLKDLSLAFALSRLLRCRLEDVKLKKDIYLINRKLVRMRIIDRDGACAFKILETQLGFVNDYFNTRYPMVFWLGLCSLYTNLLMSLVTFCVVLWLSVDIRKVYKPPKDELAHMVRGVNVDMIITWVFMFCMMFKEIWEMVIYLLSDWTRLLLVCKYTRHGKHCRNRCMENLILSFFKSKIIAKRWHGLLDQYVFLQSYDYIPTHWNRIHKVTTGALPKRGNGAKLGNAIDIPDCIRSEIMEKIRAILDMVNTDDYHLPQVITTLSGDRRARYGWACFHLQTSSQIILVWHIATNYCQLALAKKNGPDLSKPAGFLRSILGCITNFCSLNEYEFNLTERLKQKYLVANSLSSYCGYLLVSKPDLIPDSFLVPKMVFQKTVKSARDGILKDCDCLEKRYNKLKEEAGISVDDYDNVQRGGNVLKQGALLGKQLTEHESEEDCWDILAGVWAELLIHIAPSWNAEAHKKCLESGGEFLTNIWALLWHCGIEKSSLWPVDDAFENNAPAEQQDNDDGNDSNNIVDVTQQTDTDTRCSQVETEVHEEAEVSETEESETNLGIELRRMKSVSSQTEEVSQGMTENDSTVQTGMDAGCQTQIKSELEVEDIATDHR